jgi:ribosome maturation factor RimP
MDLKTRIETLADSVCRDLGLQLIDAEVKGDAKQTVFRIYADSEKGITLGECEAVSRALMDRIDIDDGYPRNYRLDVSSPGLDRPLVTDFDFRKNIGQEVAVYAHEESEKKQYTGRLIRYDEDFIYLEQAKQDDVSIRRDHIDQVKIKLKW